MNYLKIALLLTAIILAPAAYGGGCVVYDSESEMQLRAERKAVIIAVGGALGGLAFGIGALIRGPAKKRKAKV